MLEFNSLIFIENFIIIFLSSIIKHKFISLLNRSFQSIVIAGGGTGGHLFPGISIAEYFHKMQPFCKIRFIGTNRGIEKKVLSKTNFSLFLLPVLGLYRVGMFKKIISLEDI